MLLQTRSVTATARRLGASQPTASRALARLREMFNDPLLIRTNRGMELTRKAEELVSPLEDWLASTHSLFVADSFDPASIDRRFRIAATDFGVATVVAPALQRLQAEAPGAAFDMVAYAENMPARLASGELDLILTGLDPDLSVIYGEQLFSDPLVCVARADHPLFADLDGAIGIDSYLSWPHVSLTVGDDGFDRVASYLGGDAERRRVVATLPYFHTAPLLTGGTDAIVTVARRTAKLWSNMPGVAFFDPPAEFPPFTYWALYHERNRRDPATRWIVDVLARACASAGG